MADLRAWGSLGAFVLPTVGAQGPIDATIEAPPEVVGVVDVPAVAAAVDSPEVVGEVSTQAIVATVEVPEVDGEV